MNIYATISQLKAIRASGEVLAFCKATGRIYYYDSNSTLTANDVDILTTGNGGNTRWLSLKTVYPPHFRATRASSTQSINNITWTTIIYNSELIDTHAAYSTSTGVYTIPLTGKYFFTASMRLDNDTAGKNHLIALYRGGSTMFAETLGVTGVNPHRINVSALYSFTAGDTVEAKVYHNYGSARNIVNDEATNFQGFLIY